MRPEVIALICYGLFALAVGIHVYRTPSWWEY